MQLSDRAILEEFDVEKYNICEDWNIDNWLIALSSRMHMRQFFRTRKGGLAKSPMPKAIFSDEREFHLKLAEARIKDPLHTRATFDKTPFTIAPCVIQDFMVADIPHVTEIAENASENFSRDNMWIPLRDVQKTITPPSHTFYLGIDLYAQDEIIQEKFGNWLKKTRHETGITPQYPGPLFKEKDLKGWHADKLLPFLDLAFWVKLSGIALSESDMGERLFPSALDDPELENDHPKKMRSIAKKALRLISKEYAEILATQCQTY